ncbi:hypothetical protein, partial [Brachyspira hampsonii]
MFKSRKNLIVLLFSVSLIFVSCNANQNPKTFKLSELVGTWETSDLNADFKTFVVTSNGEVYSDEIGARTLVLGWDGNDERELFSVGFIGSGIGSINLTFNDSSSCEASGNGKIIKYTK